MSKAIVTDRSASLLLRTLHAFLPDIVARLGDAACWRGWFVGDDAVGYSRLVCRDELVGAGGRPRVVVAGHEFAGRGCGELHDHRFPLAVLPLAATAGDGALYHMPWQRRGPDGAIGERGEHPVWPGVAYAIEDCRAVWHAVQSQRPHLSVVLSDVSGPPAREDRLVSRPLADDACATLRQRLRVAAAAQLVANRGCAT